jgi:outer membrane biosynthesis protein TonB
MPLLERILTPVNALLPDVSRVPRWRQAVGAIVASLVVHLILLLLFVAVAAILPEGTMKLAQPEAQLAPLEVQIITPSQEDLVTPEELKAAAQRPVIDSTGLAKTEEASKDAIFESDENMKAGSQQPATGDLPMPSQEGRNLPFPQFTNQNAMLGSTKTSPSPELPEVPPAQTAAPKVAESKPKSQPKEAKSTPPPKAPETTELKPDEIAVAQKPKPRTSAPELAPQPLPEETPDRQEMAKLTTPAPKKSRRSGYQEEQMKTRVEGNISNRGPRGVDAAKTPLGMYLKQVKAQIGSRWYYYLEKRRDLYATGSVRLSFVINKNGEVREVRVRDNTSNAAFALMCQQCVIEAEIPPPPVEAEAIMPNGQLEQDLNFNYVPFQ